jgi:hypothetical protein
MIYFILVGASSTVQYVSYSSLFLGIEYILCFLICSWTIDTKYYTADVCIWTARLDALVSKDNGPPPLEHCEALLMVFDLSDVRGAYIITFIVF